MRKVTQWLPVLLFASGHPSRLLAAYDSGDQLRPGDAGSERLAEMVPLAAFGASR
jgi:hypothetical protein